MKRITRLLLLAVLGGAALIFSAAPAGAAGESIEGCTIEGVDEEILEGASSEEIILLVVAALEEGDPDHSSEEYKDALHEVEEIVAECIEAPNVLLPEINEVIWGAVGFFIVLIFIMKFGWPAIKKSMDERTEKIQAELDAAEQAKADAEATKAEFAAKVADAKTEAARIIEEARQSADQLKADQQARLNDELAAARAAAQADIDAAKSQAMAELRGEVATIAIGAAESVVGANLDRAAQERLVEDYINRVGSNS
ncbi:MAG: F0F1 ATP synthase subunit B [Acidimicrobiales bacterium]|nr:F0F1 ATP synthase subunit B [Acidimicrobiales bacterium]